MLRNCGEEKIEGRRQIKRKRGMGSLNRQGRGGGEMGLPLFLPQIHLPLCVLHVLPILTGGGTPQPACCKHQEGVRDLIKGMSE